VESGNEVTGMRLHFNTQFEDPLERVRLSDQDAVASKAYANAIGKERLTAVVDAIPSGVVFLGMRFATADCVQFLVCAGSLRRKYGKAQVPITLAANHQANS